MARRLTLEEKAAAVAESLHRGARAAALAAKVGSSTVAAYRKRYEKAPPDDPFRLRVEFYNKLLQEKNADAVAQRWIADLDETMSELLGYARRVAKSASPSAPDAIRAVSELTGKIHDVYTTDRVVDERLNRARRTGPAHRDGAAPGPLLTSLPGGRSGGRGSRS